MRSSESDCPPTAPAAAKRPPVGTPRRTVVRMIVEKDGLRVSGPAGRGPDATYATRLLRDGQRVAETRYSRSTDAWFGWPTVPGVYQAVRLERAAAGGEVTRAASHPMRLPVAGTYDPAPWCAASMQWDEPDAVQPVDGLQRIVRGASSLDLLVDGSARARRGSPLLVCLNASIAGRDTKVAPFFSGLKLAAACGLPYLGFSDPAVARNGQLALGWYAGTDDQPELPQRIARVIDRIASGLGAGEAILVGGSGGGFAALSVQAHLETPFRLLVWNPQTSIAHYHAPAVHAYLRVAFPEVAARHGLPAKWHRDVGVEQLSKALDATGTVHDLVHRALPGRRPSLYFQNRSDDLHVQRHLGRYLEPGALEPLLRQGRTTVDGMTYCVGDWGKGHLTLPQRMIVSMIGGLARGTWPEVADTLIARLSSAGPANH